MKALVSFWVCFVAALESDSCFEATAPFLPDAPLPPFFVADLFVRDFDFAAVDLPETAGFATVRFFAAARTDAEEAD